MVLLGVWEVPGGPHGVWGGILKLHTAEVTGPMVTMTC